MLEGVDLFARHYVVHERARRLPANCRWCPSRAGESHEIEFPESAYSVSAGANAEFDTDVFRFEYESLVTPDSVFDYDMNTRERKPAQAAPGAGRL